MKEGEALWRGILVVERLHCIRKLRRSHCGGGGSRGPVERYFSGREICSLSIELPVCEAWRKGRPCGEVF